MSLATRCPRCNTLFKVSAGQLQLHDGQVRCGQCKSVFSGIEHLTAADSTVWANLKLGASDESSPAPATETLPALQGFSAPAPRLTQRFMGLPVWARIALPSLILLLAMQVALGFRTTLLQQLPLNNQTLSNVPAWLQRWTALPATAALRIEGSGLNKRNSDEVVLELTLKNQQHLPAHWPHLRVTLVDSNEQVLAVRTLKPADYQLRDKHISPNLPVPPGATLELSAYLNLSKLKQQLPERETAGFKLELLDGSPDFI